MRLWWLKLTKQIPQNAEEELVNHRRTLANIEWRRQEARGALDTAASARRSEIERRHEAERRTLQPEPLNPASQQPDDNHHDPSGDDETLGPSLEL